MTAPLGPRLVRSGDAPSGQPPASSVTGRTAGRWALPLALAIALVAAAAWSVELRRADALALRVRELSRALRSAEAQIDADRRHLGEIRDGVAGVRERLDALQALAAKDPAQPDTGASSPEP